MFFHKKKKSEPVPQEEIQKLTSAGMSDKDIIKQLKSKGYSYEEIEKAMMSAVKKNVEEPSFSNYQSYENPQQRQRKQQSELPEIPELSQYKPEQDLMESLDISAPDLDINPDILVEEIVEGVVDEKWEKFEERIRKVENDYSVMKMQVKQMHEQPAKTQEPSSHEYDARINDVSDQMEDLQARVGGLEKAFKQFLPSLTKNIESLSGLIHEMKEKQENHHSKYLEREI